MFILLVMYCEELNQRVSGKENEEINESNIKGNVLNLCDWIGGLSGFYSVNAIFVLGFRC